MNLGSIYLIVKDFNKSIKFYEALLGIPVSSKNMDRFAQFEFEGKNISIMNGYFDSEHPDLVEHKGEYTKEFDDLVSIAEANNTHKFVLNFFAQDLRVEYERIKKLNLSSKLTSIKYVNNVMPYYYFQLDDPDGNVIEITGSYYPSRSEFEN